MPSAHTHSRIHAHVHESLNSRWGRVASPERTQNATYQQDRERWIMQKLYSYQSRHVIGLSRAFNFNSHNKNHFGFNASPGRDSEVSPNLTTLRCENAVASTKPPRKQLLRNFYYRYITSYKFLFLKPYNSSVNYTAAIFYFLFWFFNGRGGYFFCLFTSSRNGSNQ